MHRFPRRGSLLAGSLVILLGACLLGGGGKPDWADEAEQEFGEPVGRDITVEITNQNFYDANVYALIGTQRQRLGNVRSQESETFTFPWPRTELRVLVRLIGGGRDRASPSYTVGPGDQLSMVIDPEGRVYRTR